MMFHPRIAIVVLTVNHLLLLKLPLQSNQVESNEIPKSIVKVMSRNYSDSNCNYNNSSNFFQLILILILSSGVNFAINPPIHAVG